MYRFLQAQRLGATITTPQKLYSCTGDQKLYIKVEDNKALGFIKTGNKNLYITHANGMH